MNRHDIARGNFIVLCMLSDVHMYTASSPPITIHAMHHTAVRLHKGDSTPMPSQCTCTVRKL